jgi:hypothetical protein
MAVYEKEASLESAVDSGTNRNPRVGSHFAASSMAAARVRGMRRRGFYHEPVL